MTAIEYVADPFAWKPSETFRLRGLVAALTLSGIVFKSDPSQHGAFFEHDGVRFRLTPGHLEELRGRVEFAGGVWDWTMVATEAEQAATVARAVGVIVWCDQMQADDV